jgi:nicotinamidase-related amidase
VAYRIVRYSDQNPVGFDDISTSLDEWFGQDVEVETMLIQMIKPKRKQVLLDINTQRDYLLANGHDCIRNHRRVLTHIRRIMAWARIHDVPIISTCQVHSNCNGNGNGHGNGHTPSNGANGSKKVPYTLVANRISFAPDTNTDLPRDLLRQYQQVIFHKRCLDPFDEPRIDRLLTEMKAGEFILIGTTTEGEIQAAALGLLQRHRHVTVVVDAIGSRDLHEAHMALRKMDAKGAHLVETRKLAGISHLRMVGACPCESCQRLSSKTSSFAHETN